MAEKTIQKFLLGVFDDEGTVLEATRKLKAEGVPLHDVYTPYAVHGLDEAMGIRRSRLPIVCFIAGLTGFVLALFFQMWVFTSDWPINVGGKPFAAVPAFIPVTFEITVLIGGLTTVAAFLLRSRLYPGACMKMLDPRITDDRFVIAIAKTDASLDVGKIDARFKSLGAVEVRESEVESC